MSYRQRLMEFFHQQHIPLNFMDESMEATTLCMIPLHIADNMHIALLKEDELLNPFALEKMFNQPIHPVETNFSHFQFEQALLKQAFIIDESLLQISELQLRIFSDEADNEEIFTFEYNGLHDWLQDKTHATFAINRDAMVTNFDATQKSMTDSQLGIPRYSPECLLQLIELAQDFPVLTTTAQELLKLQGNPNATVEDLAPLVEQCPSLAVQVLKWANSPYYGYPSEIESIDDAILKVLGFEMVLYMAIGLAIGEKFSIPLQGPLGQRAYWEHAIHCATLTEQLAKRIPASRRPNIGLIYLDALIHNFGILILGQLFPQHHAKITELLPFNRHLSLLDVEDFVLGVSHDELGGWLMRHWNMPTSVYNAVRKHHQHDISEFDEIVPIALIQIANTLLGHIDIGDMGFYPMNAKLLQYCSLNRDIVEDIFASFIEQSPRLKELAEYLAKS